MSLSSVDKKFVFNGNIDAGFICSLYENDYNYIAEVFQTSLAALDDDLPALDAAYRSADLQAMKRMLHKLKPLFGYTGLLRHQELIGEFENRCALPSLAAQVIKSYPGLLNAIEAGKKIILEEYERLNSYNGVRP